MNTKTKYTMVLALAALALPLSLANADVSLDWNNNTNNEVGVAPVTINATPGGTITLELDLVSTSQRTDTVDYWLTQIGGTAGAFSISQRNLTTATYNNNPSSTDAAVAASTDMKNNTTNATGSDGIPDNQLNPRNGFDLGAGTPMAGSAGGDVGTGSFQVAIFTLSFSATAASGLYHIQSFDYSGRGWSDTVPGTQQAFDQPFTRQADIIINLVPEPATLSLLGLGGLGALGITLLRARRRLS